MDEYGEKLAKELNEDYPAAAAVLRGERSQPNAVRRLAAALTPLLGANARSSTISMIDSTLNIGRPNGLARKRRTTRGSQQWPAAGRGGGMFGPWSLPTRCWTIWRIFTSFQAAPGRARGGFPCGSSWTQSENATDFTSIRRPRA